MYKTEAQIVSYGIHYLNPSSHQCQPAYKKYCIKGNVNVCLIFPNLPNGFETGTIKTLSLIIFVDMVGKTMQVFRLSSKAGYLSYSLSQQSAPYVF